MQSKCRSTNLHSKETSKYHLSLQVYEFPCAHSNRMKFANECEIDDISIKIIYRQKTSDRNERKDWLRKVNLTDDCVVIC